MVGQAATELLARPGRHGCLSTAGWDSYDDGVMRPPWPIPNLWLGVSIESQYWAGIRLPKLLATPAAIRFVSCEPLLERVNLASWLGVEYGETAREWLPEMFASLSGRLGRAGGLDWVIAGGESGPGARPMHPDWARLLRDQCEAAGDVAFFFKQWGSYGPLGPVYDPKHPEDEVWDENDLIVDGSGCVIEQFGGVPIAWNSRGYTYDRQPAPGAWWMQKHRGHTAGRELDGREHLDFPAPPTLETPMPGKPKTAPSDEELMKQISEMDPVPASVVKDAKEAINQR
jgi:hypothetical protein